MVTQVTCWPLFSHLVHVGAYFLTPNRNVLYYRNSNYAPG
jgi:hypothetical protein